MNDYDSKALPRFARFARLGAALTALALLLGLAAGCASPADLGKLTTPSQWRESLQAPLASGDAEALSAGPSLHGIVRLAMESKET